MLCGFCPNSIWASEELRSAYVQWPVGGPHLLRMSFCLYGHGFCHIKRDRDKIREYYRAAENIRSQTVARIWIFKLCARNP